MQIQPQAHDPSPRFDHAMALVFYNAIKPNGLVLGYTDGRPVADTNQFEQIAKEADSRGEHFFFAVATLKPEWSDPNTHQKGKVTTPSKDKPSICRTAAKATSKNALIWVSIVTLKNIEATIQWRRRSTTNAKGSELRHRSIRDSPS